MWEDDEFLPKFDADDEEIKEEGGVSIEEDVDEEIKDIKPQVDSESDSEDGMKIEAMRWGLYHPKTKDIVINAWFEDLPKRPMFWQLVNDFRCVITIDGYYEWYDPNMDKKNTQPYYIYPKDNKPLTIAGLFKPQVQKDGSI